MKTLFFFFSICLASSAFSQACQEVIFKDSTEMSQIGEYIVSLKGHKTNSLGGVVVLYRFENKGDKCWRLRYAVDDRCLDECPTKYSYDSGIQIILIHDADEEGNPIPNPNCQQSRSCIEEVVQGWLYIHPRKDKWMVYRDFDGNSRRVNISKQPRTGGDYLSRMIRFKKDGTVVPFYDR